MNAAFQSVTITGCILDVLCVEEAVKKSMQMAPNKQKTSGPSSSVLVWSCPACSPVWSRDSSWEGGGKSSGKHSKDDSKHKMLFNLLKVKWWYKKRGNDCIFQMREKADEFCWLYKIHPFLNSGVKSRVEILSPRVTY